jgi:hypothetical protein
MTKLTLPGEIGRQLTAAGECIELCNEGGQTIGFFTPAVAGQPRGPQVNDDELARRECEESTYSTDEVLAHLRSL